jgi:energy-coupling factor transporter ATP-binding protein EcfA2
MKPSINLPNRTGTGDNESYTSENNIVIIGANGSGKTRLGSWIESNISPPIKAHRISAQRALNIPEFAAVKNLEQAEIGLFYGREDQRQTEQVKNIYRWGSTPETHMLNDYDKLLSALFAKTSKRDSDHTKATKESQSYLPVQDSPIDIIVRLWNDVMPHREISFEDGKVLVNKDGIAEYHGKGMSDGERVTLYLIGQCLCAPENSVIIIDEPEIHLHKALMSRLWDKIEDVSPNKLLIYITHDLDFASSRKGAAKLWIKNYDGKKWVWEEVPEEESIPENLLLEILGNRKNIIFCEGEHESTDTIIYSFIYPQFHIISRSGGDKVVESTKALRSNPSLHHLSAFGITDSDYKEDEEKRALEQQGIYTIAVAEIESLFCVEAILRIIAEHLELNADETVEKVKDFLIDSLNGELELQISSKAEKIIEYKLGAYSKKRNNKQGLIDALAETNSRINIDEIYQQCDTLFKTAIDNRDLERLLLIYNRKSLPNRISGIFGLGKGEYEKLMLRLLRGSKTVEITNALKQYLPNI